MGGLYCIIVSESECSNLFLSPGKPKASLKIADKADATYSHLFAVSFMWISSEHCSVSRTRRLKLESFSYKHRSKDAARFICLLFGLRNKTCQEANAQSGR